MRRKQTTIIMGLMLAVAVALSGCETTGGSVASGAVLGGLAGAVIGNQSGHAGEGAAIGAVLGGLVGYGVHKYKARQTQTAQETYKEYKYEPDQGFQLDMKEGSISPSIVKPGQTVTATMKYAALGTGAGMPIEEVRTLKKDTNATDLDKETIVRTDGTYEGRLDFQVPEKSPAGDYKLTQRITSSGKSAQETLAFQVQPVTAQLEDGTTELRYEISMITTK